MIKSVGNDPVHTLLSPDSNVVYQVPIYQREYSWSKQQWDDLFDDLQESDPDGGHFLGTIICVNQTENSTREVVLELIDGQQRMTTLSLLLAALLSALSEFRQDFDDDQLSDFTNLRRMLGLKGKPMVARLRPQKQNSNYEDYLHVLREAGLEVDAPSVRYAGVRRIMKAFRHFQSRIADLVGEGDVVEALLELLKQVKSAVVVKLEVENHSDAFVLFESLNNRGMPLTPIDLIKNNLLASSDRTSEFTTDEVFARWNELLADLGDDYAIQERFFRQYYNAFKADLPAVPNARVATRSNLIRIYEEQIRAGLADFLAGIVAAGEQYRRLIGNFDDEAPRTSLDEVLANLNRVQGAPSHMVLLYLLRRREELGLSEADIEQAARLLLSFFVRRHLTGVPATYEIQYRFMDLIDLIRDLQGDAVLAQVRAQLVALSASDERFREALHGDVYQDNVDVARFILVALSEQGFTNEIRPDLWQRDGTHFRWTIEHILPQGENLPAEWIQMLGGDPAEAAAIQRKYVHTLGNLTVTGYNSTLSNKSFESKKDREDARGNKIGFRNGLVLNADVVAAERWTAAEIEARTDLLARRTLELFPL